MFIIDYDTWKDVCSMYFRLSKRTASNYLQLYPFSRLDKSEKTTVLSEDFFYTCISNGNYVNFEETMFRVEHYMQKVDSSFRRAALVSPILFLIIQCIGKKISESYKTCGPKYVSAFYGGNYSASRCHYKKDYDDFFKYVNECGMHFEYFIKSDVRDFFSNIDLNILIRKIGKLSISNGENIFSQIQLEYIKKILSHVGQNKYPVIEMSMASSYLSTIIYLDEIDKNLYQYIDKLDISFQMVRYVDDLYILFSLNNDESTNSLYNKIITAYSSFLKEFYLSLNIEKCCIKPIAELPFELKKSFYFNDDIDFKELCPNGITSFIAELEREHVSNNLSVITYNEAIKKAFQLPKVEYLPFEIYNKLIYSNTTWDDKETINSIKNIIQQSNYLISLDPKRLTILITKTNCEVLIKKLLNNLFEKNKTNNWNAYDTSITLSYLIKRNFKHRDLLLILEERDKELYKYYELFCNKSFLSIFSNKVKNRLIFHTKSDSRVNYLYFMYSTELCSKNYMSAFSYFKNFFDRATAFLDKDNYKKNTPNFSKSHEEKKLLGFYKNILNYEVIIKKAHSLRNASPLSHASSDLLGSPTTSHDLQDSISELNKLIISWLEEDIKNK